MTSFPTPDPVSAHIEIAMGDVRITAGPGDETLVDVVPTDPTNEKDCRTAEETSVSCSDGRLEVLGPGRGVFAVPRKPGSVQVSVTLPTGSALDTSTALGLITADGKFGAVTAKSGAGDIRVQDATSADLKTGLGTVVAGHVGGEASCSTGSGVVHIERIDGAATVKNSNGDTRIGHTGGAARVKAANGAVLVERARADLAVSTANGNLRVGCAERGSVQLRTAMGSITVGIPKGTAARLDLRTSFGNVRNELDAADAPPAGETTVEIHAETSAGDIDVVRVPGDDA